MPKLIAHRFQLQRLLGEGTFAEVWQALDIGSTDIGLPKKTVALKIFRSLAHAGNPASWEPLKNEIAAAYRLPPHPNIVSVLAIVQAVYFNEKETPCLILDYVAGMNLAEFLQPLPPPTLQNFSVRLQVMTALLSALAHCHVNGVVHRDLSFGNLLICLEDPQLSKLTDFGSSQTQLSQQSLTALQDPAGTLQPINHPPYATSLSLADGFRRDIYGFAVLCYLTLTGKHPLSENWQSMRTGQWHAVPNPHVSIARKPLATVAPWLKPLPQLKALSALLLACLAPDISDRPLSAVSVWSDWQKMFP